jgi:hypothetical protein
MSRVVAGKRARLQPVAKDRRGAEQGGQWGKIVRLLQSQGHKNVNEIKLEGREQGVPQPHLEQSLALQVQLGK